MFLLPHCAHAQGGLSNQSVCQCVALHSKMLAKAFHQGFQFSGITFHWNYLW